MKWLDIRFIGQTEKQKYTPTKGHRDAGESPDGEATGAGTPGENQSPAWSKITPEEWLLERVVGN